MLTQRPAHTLAALSAILHREHEQVIAEKEKAVHAQQFEFARDLRLIEKRLHDFMDSIKNLEQEFC